MVRSHAPSRHTLTVLSLDTVMMRPSGTDRRHAFHHVRMLEAHAAVRLLGGRRGVAERAAGALDALDVADEAELRQHQAEDLGREGCDRHCAITLTVGGRGRRCLCRSRRNFL